MDTSNLLSRIEHLRNSMIEVAIEKGFSSRESIAISRELDKLLNEYEQVRGFKK
ncbi:aspartyl-phosphate phosphatase Spo0E family protein [Amphibacillus cookii]|uniref:aspartyl-phosphate phosphatase Spo0E family protein n=1 Tax=Amphibacillus cookii TaxID=767787 RepID=UPI0023BA5CA7|nr:aspartyl-phosphate phosphatase Spo0E family protein [Amphibacillus cookii]MBM7540408.1 stage 0 sporulation regulatory protein [Amphibacillus cookii]